MFGLVGLAPIALYAASQGDGRLVTYTVVLVASTFVVAAIDARIGLTRAVVWALAVWAIGHLAGGMLPGVDPSPILYNTWLVKPALKFDQLVHCWGFGTATAVSWQVLRARLAPGAPIGGALTMAVLMGLGVGAANEIVEFLSVGGLPDEKVGDFANVGWDLVYDLAGGIVYALWVGITTRTADRLPSDA